MDKLKNPKVYGPVIAVILTILMAMFADLKPVLREICAGVELKADPSEPSTAP